MKPRANHRPWINFRELRTRLDFERVLQHYKVEVYRKGEQHQGPCPLPDHSGHRGDTMFSANLTRGIFRCFGCGAQGNVLEFATLMEKADPNNGDALRKVAVVLQEKFFPQGASRRHPPAAESQYPSKGAPVLVNEPLDFLLKDLDTGHPWFAERGLSSETVRHFGLGYCSRGYLKGRIAIPLHDGDGRLIGYAGHLVDKSAASNENPLCLFPSRRERHGKILDFQRTTFLYNGNRVEPTNDDLVVVESIVSVWWLHQHGYPRTVALMNPRCSAQQVQLLARLSTPSGRLWLMTEGRSDEDELAKSFLLQVSPHRFSRWIQLDTRKRPCDLSAQQLSRIFS